MAVEASHPSLLFPPQLLSNRESMNEFEGNNENVFGSAVGLGYGLPPPLSGTTITGTLLPMYGSLVHDAKTDSGLTYALPVSRKRSRDAFNPLFSFPNAQSIHQSRCSGGSLTFLDQDISSQIQQQRLEIDLFIAQHTEKVRYEIEERRKRYLRRIMAAVEESIVKNLRAKEEEIEKIGKLNWALEQKVKSLCIENQIWRDLAHSNEATANALRTNLEQLLAQIPDDQCHRTGSSDDDEVAAALIDDAQSCCGSNFGVNGIDTEEGVEQERPALEEDRAGERKSSAQDNGNRNGTGVGGGGCSTIGGNTGNNGISSSRRRWLCRKCGKAESCVLLLPCRHLCLCSVCGSSLDTCPICLSTKNGTLLVNLSF